MNTTAAAMTALHGDRHGRLPLALVTLTVAAVAAMGFGVAQGQWLVSALTLVGMLGLVLAPRPAILLWALLLLGLIGAGLTKLYLPGWQELRWAVVPLSGLLLGHVLLARLAVQVRPAPGKAPPLLGWALAFIAWALLVSVLQQPDPGQLLRGVKGYFQVWGLLFALALLAWPRALMRERLPAFVLALGLLQLPFALQQWWVLVPQRAAAGLPGIVPADIIAGTFGGQVDGGGANSLLALVQCIVIAGLLALWQQGRLRARWLWLGLPLLLAPLLVNQAKVSLLYLALVFLLLFGAELWRRPLHFAAGLLALGLLLAALIGAYTTLSGNPAITGARELVRESWATNVTADHLPSGELTRTGALRYWAAQHVPHDLPGALLGHGLYETRQGEPDGAAALWDAAAPALGIKNTTISALLWDVGVLGLLLVGGLFIAAIATAGRALRRHAADPWLTALLRAGRVAVVLLFCSLWIKSYFGYHVAFQTLFALLFGWLGYWAMQAPTDKGGAQQPTGCST